MARIAVVGAGWAGLAAAVLACQDGHAVTLFEAARSVGGRARSLDVALPCGDTLTLDNGQHILVGAYTKTLSMMQAVGLQPEALLHALPLCLQTPDGQGLALPAWPAPLDAAWGVARARGWSWRDKLSLLRAFTRWRLGGFTCAASLSVAALGRDLAPAIMRDLVEPLCVAALNTRAHEASAQVFLRVLKDALFGPGWGGWGGSWLLLPRVPLGALFPQAAADWLVRQAATLRLGERVSQLSRTGGGWELAGEAFDAVILATPPREAARLVEPFSAGWAQQALALQHEAIATVYATGGPPLPHPLLALRSGPQAPAQFVLDRSQLGGPRGLLAFVVSASQGDREAVQSQVMMQAHALGWTDLRPVSTVIEKRATFACTPGLQRPASFVAPGLWACGDYVDGPYPATLEGAVRSVGDAVRALSAATHTAR